MKKKILAMLFSMVMIASLVACGNTQADNVETDIETDETVVEEEIDDSEDVEEETVTEEISEDASQNNEYTEQEIADMVSEGVSLMHTDRASALELFEQAAELGNEDGMFLSGYMYDWEGHNFNSIDMDKAFEYYEMVADTNPYALICISFETEDEKEAKNLADEAIAMIDFDSIDDLVYAKIAYDLLGELYLTYPSDKDYAYAKECLVKAAEMGNSHAMYVVGQLYSGRGNEDIDYDTAIEWFEKAIEQGESYSMYVLGKMYFEGEGVEQNLDIAKELIEKAASVGHPIAQEYLDENF